MAVSFPHGKKKQTEGDRGAQGQSAGWTPEGVNVPFLTLGGLGSFTYNRLQLALRKAYGIDPVFLDFVHSTSG